MTADSEQRLELGRFFAVPEGLDENQARVIAHAVDAALKGSEYGLEAWKEIRKVLISGRPFTLDQWNRIIDLVDRAIDDGLGPKLRVDLSLDRIYSIGQK